MTSLSAGRYALLLLLVIVVASTPGCAAVAGIFKAGMWVGVILAVLVIGGAVVIFTKFRSWWHSHDDGEPLRLAPRRP